MKEEEEAKKIENPEEEILNHQEKEQLEGGSESDTVPNEKLNLSDMEEVEGGDRQNASEELEKDEGSGGGIVCWC